MTEAKDWAGELISGQTTTGRILVSEIIRNYFNDTFFSSKIARWNNRASTYPNSIYHVLLGTTPCCIWTKVISSPIVMTQIISSFFVIVSFLEGCKWLPCLPPPETSTGLPHHLVTLVVLFLSGAHPSLIWFYAPEMWVNSHYWIINILVLLLYTIHVCI